MYQQPNINQNGQMYYTPQNQANPYDQLNKVDDIQSKENDSIIDNKKNNYTAYTLKQYKDRKQMESFNYKGLGPTLPAEELQKQKEKRDRMSEFAQQVKQYNQTNIPSNNNKKAIQQKEVSKFDKAKEFAKNVPKPKQKPERENSVGGEKQIVSQGKGQRSRSNYQRDDEFNSGGGFEENEMDQLERAHMEYLNKIQSINNQQTV